MKIRNLLLNAIALTLSCNLTAQPPHWRATAVGNTTTAPDGVTGANNMLGTPLGVDLRFGTNGGTERMRITSTGLVGIGLNPTNTLLHLQSNTASNGNLFRTDGLTADLNRWQLFTGGTEKFSLFVPQDSLNVHLNAFDNSATMQFQTGGITRMFINQRTATTLYGVNTAGFIGLGGITDPASPLHILGRQNANSAGWDRALTISGGSLYFTHANYSTADTVFFMAFPSVAPGGNFFAASASNLDATATVDNAYMIGCQTPVGGFGSVNPLNSLQFFKNVVVAQSATILPANERRFGVNTLNPQNIVHINTAGTSAGSGNSGLRFEDLTNASTPIANSGNMGVLSVNENGDVIYVPGTGGGVDNDNQTLFFGFTGNVLDLGITGGNTINIPLPSSTVDAENGLSVAAGKVVLGQDIGEAGNPAKLISNREIPMEDNTIDFKGQGTVHISQGSTNLNTNAALDINTTQSTNEIALHIKDDLLSAPTKKGILVDMTFRADNTEYAGIQIGDKNNSTSGTSTPCIEKSWLLKTYADSYYTKFTAEPERRVAFGVEATGRMGLNAPQCDYRLAPFTMQDHLKNPDISNPYYITTTAVENVFKPSSRSLLINAINTTNSLIKSGIEIYTQNNSGFSYGIYAVGEGASTSPDSQNSGIGVVGIGKANSATRADPIAIGVKGVGLAFNNVNAAIGLDGFADGAQGINYGVYGHVDRPNDANYYAGFFDGKVEIRGNLFVNGQVSSTNGTIIISDQQFKTNVDTISNPLSIVKNLNPKSFYFDTINNHGMDFSSKKQYGFIAQEVEVILPELVNNVTKSADYDSLGVEINPSFDYKSLNYNAFIAILTDAVQEQQTQIEAKDSLITDLTIQNQNQQTTIDDLNTRLARLESCLSSLLPTLCEMNQSAIQQTPQETQRQLAERISVSLSDKNTLVLSQNVPNPFAEKTVISYNIPTNVAQAQIHFYNGEGKIINSVDIKERGNGELTVFANDLSSGIYTYTLVADGKIVATKKMMKN